VQVALQEEFMPKTRSKKTPAGARFKSRPSRKKTSSPTVPAKLRGRDLEKAVEQFQAEPDEKKAHERWKHIESSVFGVQFED
jgi:hypothetical protein